MTFRRLYSSDTGDSSGQSGRDARAEAFSLGLRNRSGVPILDVAGEINRATIRAIEDLASQLVRAGHVQIVLNLERALALNARVIRSLGGLAREARKRHGQITLVTGLENAGQRWTAEVRQLFRLAVSEAGALVHIKGLAQMPGDEHPAVKAKLAK